MKKVAAVLITSCVAVAWFDWYGFRYSPNRRGFGRHCVARLRQLLPWDKTVFCQNCFGDTRPVFFGPGKNICHDCDAITWSK